MGQLVTASEFGGNGSVVLKCVCLFTPPPPLLTSYFWPNRDAWSVCSGKKMEEHQVIDAKTELVITKCAEMICESIPGCLLQLYVILKVGDMSERAVASVMVSALTAGYSSGTMR